MIVVVICVLRNQEVLAVAQPFTRTERFSKESEAVIVQVGMRAETIL